MVLQLEGKRILIFGVANRKSVAAHVAKTLRAAGAECVFVVQSDEIRQGQRPLFGDGAVFVCDVEVPDQIARLRQDIAARFDRFDGLVHSIAFADYSGTAVSRDPKPSSRRDISCYSLIAIAAN